MDTFTWVPAYGAQLSETPRVLQADFGAGNIDRAPDGINRNPQIWRMTFTTPQAIGDNIRNFLLAHSGTIPFAWTNPLGEAIQVTCAGWSTSYGGPGVVTVQADFQQWFGFAP